MSTLKTDVIKDVAETVAINVTDIGSVVSLPQDLANDSDPTKGSAMVGYRGRDLHERLSEFRFVEDFPGCDPTGVTPSDAAFTAAFAWANGSNRQIIARNSYYIEGSTFYVNCNVDFSASTIQSNGLYEQPIFILGINKKQVRFGTMVATGTHHLNAMHWDKNNCAVAIDPDLPVADNVIEFFRLANYRYGLKLQPGTGGVAGFFAYNTVRGAKIEDCEYNLYIDPVGNGWVNQNTFDIRTLRNNTSSIDGWAIYCTKEGLTDSPNGNVFTHIAMEGIGSKCIYWKNSNGTFIAPRFEQRPAGSIQFVGDANYAHATNFIFPDYLDDVMFSYSGTVRRPNIITDKIVRLAGVLEPGSPSLGSSTVLSRWGHSPLSAGAASLDAVRMVPGKVQLLDRPASGSQSVLMELDAVTGGVARLSFPQSGSALKVKSTASAGVEFTGPVDLFEANLYSAPTSGRLTATRAGQMMWDNTLKKPIFWDQAGGTWRDAAGVAV